MERLRTSQLVLVVDDYDDKDNDDDVVDGVDVVSYTPVQMAN